MEHFEVTYHLAGPGEDVRMQAESVLLEQTVETPRRVAERYPFVRDNLLGQVRSVTEADEGGFLAHLSLPVATASADPAQFLNVLFGNASLQPFVTLHDFEIPETLQAMFQGPRFGIDGIRARLGVHDRPLTCSALKPVGLDLEALAKLCRAFALGGIDMIKDDHYLADQPFASFETRVLACQEIVEEIAAKTGRKTLYVPNLSGTPEAVRRQADIAQEAGAQAVMVAPMLLGLPFFYELTRHRVDVPVLAHPSFGGALRIRPETLFGKLFRLFGADAVIFANYGGRFAYPQDLCGRIADTLRRPWHGFRSAFPVPAGGMTTDRTDELVSFFGPDTVLLVGGSLLEAGDALLERTRTFTESVARAALSEEKVKEEG